MPNIILRRRFSLAAALPLLLLAGCGSGNPDSMVGKDINMNAIVDTNATADTNAEESQYPQASNDAATQFAVPPKAERPTAERASDTNNAATQHSEQDTPPVTDEPPAPDSNSQ